MHVDLNWADKFAVQVSKAIVQLENKLCQCSTNSASGESAKNISTASRLESEIKILKFVMAFHPRMSHSAERLDSRDRFGVQHRAYLVQSELHAYEATVTVLLPENITPIKNVSTQLTDLKSSVLKLLQ